MLMQKHEMNLWLLSNKLLARYCIISAGRKHHIVKGVKMILVDSNKKWDYALGLIKVDGLEPSAEFLELVEKEKEGKNDYRRYP